MTKFLSRRAPADPGTTEMIQRGVQYLAFRLTETGLVASFQPGTAKAPVHVARAALAAVVADQNLAAAGETALPREARAALRARNALAEQLADLRAHRANTAQVSRRQRYLDALAALLITESIAPSAAQDGPLRPSRDGAPMIAGRTHGF